jgi:hypothetical protein
VIKAQLFELIIHEPVNDMFDFLLQFSVTNVLFFVFLSISRIFVQTGKGPAAEARAVEKLVVEIVAVVDAPLADLLSNRRAENCFLVARTRNWLRQSQVTQK